MPEDIEPSFDAATLGQVLDEGIFCTSCGWFETEDMPEGVDSRCTACGCPGHAHVIARIVTP